MDFASQFQGVLTRALLFLFLLRFSFSLSFFFLPSAFLSPSVSLLTSSSKLKQHVRRSTHSERIIPSSHHCAYFMFASSRNNLHTCKLPLAGSRCPIVKYARGGHICFVFPLYKPDTFVRASNAQVRCVHYFHNPHQQKWLSIIPKIHCKWREYYPLFWKYKASPAGWVKLKPIHLLPGDFNTVPLSHQSKKENFVGHTDSFERETAVTGQFLSLPKHKYDKLDIRQWVIFVTRKRQMNIIEEKSLIFKIITSYLPCPS